MPKKLAFELNSIPEGEDVDQDLFREIANTNQTIGRLKERRADLEGKSERAQEQITDADRRLSELDELIQVAEGARRQGELCKRIKTVLSEYLKTVTGRKVSVLEKKVEEMLRKLARKEDLVAQLTIDPKDYSVTLRDSHGDKIRKGDLSAGEKEIYAICLLWGLAKTSGRELPIVIDSPLSRLDSDHRKAIVERYYPSASRQVVILSTDTEVDKEYYRLLAPQVERAYLLDYDPSEGRTTVHDGYFWREASAR